MTSIERNNTQYISDVINIEEIEKKWVKEQPILINATTGSGKTYFTLNVLGQYCKDKGKKLIILTNRDILKKQVKNVVPKELKEYIKIKTYQSVSNAILYGGRLYYNNVDTTIENIFNDYDFIVCDECHYFFTDSTFNYETDVALQAVLEAKNSIKVFLSATSTIFEKYIRDFSIQKQSVMPLIYRVGKNLQYNNLYYYKDNDTIVSLLRNLPKNEKVIMFCKTIAEAYNNYLTFPKDSAFICSKYNKNSFAKYSNNVIQKEIEKESKFSTRILFTTKALDNGVNIIDKDVKHIICDINDFDTIQQCIGRKRFTDDEDKINLYIKKVPKNHLYGKINMLNNIIKIVQDFKAMDVKEFATKYGRYGMNGIVYSYVNNDNNLVYKLNSTLNYKINVDFSETRQMLNAKDEKYPNIRFIAERLGIPYNEFQDLEKVLDVGTFNGYMNKIVGVKLFEEEKKAFIDFLQRTAISLVNKKKTLGLKTINGFLQDIKSPYYVVSYKETRRTENYAKHYWLVCKRSEEEMKALAQQAKDVKIIEIES